MSHPLAALLGWNPVRWRLDAQRLRALLRDALPAAGGVSEGTAEGKELMVVLMPWLATAVPWYSMTLGVLLQRRGCSVRFVIDDLVFDVRRRRAMAIIASIEGVLRACVPPARIARLSQFAPDRAEAERARPQVEALARLNAVWEFKGETREAGRAELIAQAQQRLAVTYAALERLFAGRPPGVVIVPGGVYGPSGIWRQQANLHGIRFSSFDSGGPGVLTLAADGVACHLSDIPKAFRLLRERSGPGPEDDYVRRAAVEEMARRRAGTDRFSSQVAARSQAVADADGAILVALNSAWDSAALGLHRVFDSSTEWILRTCEILLTGSRATILVRQHPAERNPNARSSDDVAGLLRQRFGQEPRLRFIAAAEPINTYDLLQDVAAVVVHTSTVGLEAAAHGKPVVTASSAYYSPLGFIWRAENADDYQRLLLEAAAGGLRVTDSMREDALRCYYLTQCCNWVSSVFSPEGFGRWSRLQLGEIEAEPSVRAILRCVAEDVPIAFLNHLAAIDRLSSSSGGEIDHVAPASLP